MYFSGHAISVGKEVSVLHETTEEWRSSSMYNIKSGTRYCRRRGRGGVPTLQAGMLLVKFPTVSLEWEMRTRNIPRGIKVAGGQG